MNFIPVFPELELCTDNAAMIAWAGIEKYKMGEKNNLEFKTISVSSIFLLLLFPILVREFIAVFLYGIMLSFIS